MKSLFHVCIYMSTAKFLANAQIFEDGQYLI